MRRRFGTELMFNCERTGYWEAYRWRPIGDPKARLGNWIPTGVYLERRSSERWYLFSPYTARFAGGTITEAATNAETHIKRMPVEHRKRGCPICDGACEIIPEGSI